MVIVFKKIFWGVDQIVGMLSTDFQQTVARKHLEERILNPISYAIRSRDVVPANTTPRMKPNVIHG